MNLYALRPCSDLPGFQRLSQTLARYIGVGVGIGLYERHSKQELIFLDPDTDPDPDVHGASSAMHKFD